MITTITLNVSVDKAYRIAGSIQPGTVSRVLECTNTAGGKGLNVARIVDFCGEEVTAAGFAGGFNGRYVEALLDQDGIHHDFTRTKSETRSCINILAEDETSTEFLEPGAPVDEDEIRAFLENFERITEESDIITISGSLPKGVPDDMYAVMIRKIKEKGKKVILDTSGIYLKEGIKAGPTMIKPNEEELEAILGIEITDRNRTIEAAGKLMKYGIEYVVVSLGGDGALVVSREGTFHGRPPCLKAVNTVGCGDSMVGAFAAAMKRSLPIQEAMAYAVAVSAANAVNPETGHIRMEDVDEILPKVTVRRLDAQEPDDLMQAV